MLTAVACTHGGPSRDQAQREKSADDHTIALGQEESSCAAGDLDACYDVPPYSLADGAPWSTLSKACDRGVGRACYAAAIAASENRPAEALELLTASCEAGFSPGCCELARRHAEGIGAPRDLTAARRWVEQDCAKGERRSCETIRAASFWSLGQLEIAERRCTKASDWVACEAVAAAYAGMAGVSISAADWERAIALYAKTCERSRRGCYAWGELLLLGRGHGKNLEEAERVLKLACDAEDGDACAQHERLRLARIGCEEKQATACARRAELLGLEPRSPSDSEKAANHWKRACNLGVEGCEAAGEAYRLGVGVDADLDRAITFYRRTGANDLVRRFDEAKRACKRGLAQDCRRLGDLYFGSPAEPLQVEQARLHYERACEGLDAAACMNLVERIFSDERGEPRAAARIFAEKACEAGAGAGCGVVGMLIRQGKADGDARHFFQRGCDRQDGESCFRLGNLLRSRGENSASAEALVKRACNLNYVNACLSSSPAQSTRPTQ